MTFVPIQAVIFGKTYPEPSTRYYETVCTGALRVTDGRPVRLYPVPLRYMRDDTQYKLWDIIEVPVDRSKNDQRPESFKIDPERLLPVGHIPTDKEGWSERRKLLERSTDWHYAGMADLREANKAKKASIGLVVPGSIERVELSAKSASERDEFHKKCEELRLRKESDMFDPLYRSLDFLPNEIYLHWSCAARCDTCLRQPHRMKVLDWGLMQLARRRGWHAAVNKLEEISDPRTHDFRLFLGNFAQHPSNFGVIALWYPGRQEQTTFF
jgi:hypothetical protein